MGEKSPFSLRFKMCNVMICQNKKNSSAFLPLSLTDNAYTNAEKQRRPDIFTNARVA